MQTQALTHKQHQGFSLVLALMAAVLMWTVAAVYLVDLPLYRLNGVKLSPGT